MRRLSDDPILDAAWQREDDNLLDERWYLLVDPDDRLGGRDYIDSGAPEKEGEK